jgi:hypothetical protein
MRKLVCATVSLLVASSPCVAQCRFSQLVGYTVERVTQVNGEFQGCEFGKKIEFQSGLVLECRQYGYHYAYSPEAAIFTKSLSVGGNTFLAVKVCIDGELYDMAAVLVRPE